MGNNQRLHQGQFEWILSNNAHQLKQHQLHLEGMNPNECLPTEESTSTPFLERGHLFEFQNKDKTVWMYRRFVFRHLNTFPRQPCTFVPRVKWWENVWATELVVDKDRIHQYQHDRQRAQSCPVLDDKSIHCSLHSLDSDSCEAGSRSFLPGIAWLRRRPKIVAPVHIPHHT